MKKSSLVIIIAGSFCLNSSSLLLGEAPAPPRENAAKQNIPPAAKHEHFAEEFFNKMDANNDGKVSKEEFTKAAEERFARFDGNKDGALEKSDVPEKIRERMKQKGRQHQGGTNGDKKITKEAFMQMNAKRFEKMDANHDGFIEKSEFEADVKKMHEHMGKGAQNEPRKRPQ